MALTATDISLLLAFQESLKRTQELYRQIELTNVQKKLEQSVPFLSKNLKVTQWGDELRKKAKIESVSSDEQGITILRSLLSKRGYDLVEVTKGVMSYKRLYPLAEFMAVYAQEIHPIVKYLRHFYSQKNLNSLELEISDAESEVHIQYGFVRRLIEAGFIYKFQQNKDGSAITISLYNSAFYRRFIDSWYLEYYVAQKLHSDLFNHCGSEVFVFMNVMIKNRSSDQINECDVLLVVKKRLYWVEVKSSLFKLDLSKYIRLVADLGLDKNRSMIISGKNELSGDDHVVLDKYSNTRVFTVPDLHEGRVFQHIANKTLEG